jgi:formylglycine-generating enzyme required for sulfatase activity
MDTIATRLERLDAFDGLDRAARLALAADLAAALGPEFSPHDRLFGAREVAAVRHAPTGLYFAAIPGGSFDMGFTDDDLAEAAEYVDFTAAVQRWLRDLQACARPVHRVEVRPFLCATMCLPPELVARLSHGATRGDTMSARAAADLVATTDFRLPSEAELEYLARDGGPLHFACDAARAHAEGADVPEENGFGVYSLLTGEWTADAWHDDYANAPSTSAPWNDAGAPGVYRGALPYGVHPSEDEILFALAAFRGRAATAGDDDDGSRTFFAVRLTRDLPA